MPLRVNDYTTFEYYTFNIKAAFPWAQRVKPLVYIAVLVVNYGISNTIVLEIPSFTAN